MTHFSDTTQFAPGLDAAADSCVGVGAATRPENQDNFLLIDGRGQASFLHGQRRKRLMLPDWRAGHARVAVLDGMGGHGHGREAAEAVVAGLLEIAPCTDLADLSAQLDALHQRLQHDFAGSAPPDKRPGTTLTLLELPPGAPALLYHVGDSRLYKVTRDRAEPLTVDHVPATSFAMAGLIGERDWWLQVHGEHRPQIAQAFILGNAFADPLGLSDPLFPLSSANLPGYLRQLGDRRALVLDREAVYVLATDGFWSCADPLGWLARWPRLLVGRPDAAAAVDALFHTMRDDPPEPLYPDNLTAIALMARRQDDTALPSS